MPRPVKPALYVIRRVRWVVLLLVLVVIDAIYYPKLARGEPTGLLAPGGAIKDPMQALLILNLFWAFVLLLLLSGTGWFRRRR